MNIFVVKHVAVALVLNIMLYGEMSEYTIFKILSFISYCIAHYGLYSYSSTLFPDLKPKVMNYDLKCISDQISEEINDHINKVFTIRINHDLIVGLKEIKELLWDIKKICLEKRNKKYPSSSYLVEVKAKDTENIKKSKWNSFNGIPSSDWIQ